MKRLILSLLALVMLSVACENGHNNDLPNKPEEEGCYKGLLTVDQNDGTLYKQSDVEVDYELKDGKLNFVMYKVKFANGMPIKLDMVVEGVDYIEATDGTLTLSGDGIVPYAMGGPFEKYTITELSGEITDTVMSLDFMCGEYPVTYEGKR
ncbi:MAG: hypothetical protein J6K40_01530 [Alistipes sp.]|nr:hypothetical protein [Alistipes sp.]